jgi:hypothetical protein
MAKITSSDELKNAIMQLETRQAIQGQLLKEQFEIVYKSLKPANIIKNAMKETLSSHEVQNDLISIAGEWVSEFLSKRILKSKSEGVLKTYIEGVVHSGLSAFINKNAESLRSAGEYVFNTIFKNNKNHNEH